MFGSLVACFLHHIQRTSSVRKLGVAPEFTYRIVSGLCEALTIPLSCELCVESFLCDETVTNVSLRSGGFALGRAHHAVLVDCQHHVHQDQSAGATALPRPTLFCHAARNSLRADPVGGRRHAPVWPLQTLAAEGGCAAGSEGRGLSALRHAALTLGRAASAFWCRACVTG